MVKFKRFDTTEEFEKWQEETKFDFSNIISIETVVTYKEANETVNNFTDNTNFNHSTEHYFHGIQLIYED